MTGARFCVRGRVQGVAFRAHARHEAQRLGLVGHARNLDDGSVEVHAFGDADALDAFAAWLAHGPALARVDEVRREPLEAEDVPGVFSIG